MFYWISPYLIDYFGHQSWSAFRLTDLGLLLIDKPFSDYVNLVFTLNLSLDTPNVRYAKGLSSSNGASSFFNSDDGTASS